MEDPTESWEEQLDRFIELKDGWFDDDPDSIGFDEFRIQYFKTILSKIYNIQCYYLYPTPYGEVQCERSKYDREITIVLSFHQGISVRVMYRDPIRRGFIEEWDDEEFADCEGGIEALNEFLREYDKT